MAAEFRDTLPGLCPLLLWIRILIQLQIHHLMLGRHTSPFLHVCLFLVLLFGLTFGPTPGSLEKALIHLEDLCYEPILSVKAQGRCTNLFFITDERTLSFTKGTSDRDSVMLTIWITKFSTVTIFFPTWDTFSIHNSATAFWASYSFPKWTLAVAVCSLVHLALLSYQSPLNLRIQISGDKILVHQNS